ncbi:LysE/ArgO family amino acid transporter [Acinetobacter sp. ANC 4648]|uniref:LysE/ArgO family amino acid transporter n=1 Tax=Acinetobacter sp. ANC 4648 TaxID=1977875 RepID=UPI000A34F25A|nr:LysE/ArgO family amino acid transporter [Acinetobacter sp. ANC 4648]OTG81602.1 amino acid transporter [Acinetobacter sp. ANC 4648]
MFNPYLQGLLVGFSLILAIGAQNAFVLKQGLNRQHVFWVCLVCAFSDSVLILLGVFGFSKIIQSYPVIVSIAQYFGAAFLFIYGAQHFYHAFTVQQGLIPRNLEESNLWKMLSICLVLTWLNPHVYLDTVILLGSISTQFIGYEIYFALGAITSSWIFFYSLGYGARLLLPLFNQAKSWKILDFIIGIIMWVIALSLMK